MPLENIKDLIRMFNAVIKEKLITGKGILE